MDTEESSLDLLRVLEASAQRYETPCGEGVMVWRKWGSGEPLLCLHGGHGSWMHWVRNIGHFSRSRAFWAPDLPGYGESALPEKSAAGYDFIGAVAAGVRELFGTRPLDVVGFSLGGVIAAGLAAEVPEVVRRLVLVDTGGLKTPRGDFRMTSLRGLTDPIAIMAAHRQNLLAIMLHDPANVDELALRIQALNVPRGRIIPDGYVMPDRLFNALQRTAVPLDAIWGEFDRPHPDPELQRSVLLSFRPDLDFRVIRDAGHWSMYERAADFNRELADLLRRRR